MTLRMRVLPRFPARIYGRDGFIVVRDGSDLVIGPDYGSLITTPALEDLTTKFFQVFNADDNSYIGISAQNLADEIQGILVEGTLAAIGETTPLVDQSIYFLDGGIAATYTITSAGRALVAGVDAAAQRTTLELGELAIQPTAADARDYLELGTAATTDAADYATAGQGSTADSAIQPGDVELVPAGGTTGQVLAKASGSDHDTEWTAAGVGDMLTATYDPTGKVADAFDSANHSYDNALSGLTSVTTQDAIDELDGIKFGVVRRQVLLASASYTPHSKMLYCDVELQAAGGGGGGSTSGASQNGGATGGGAGAYTKKRFSRSDLGALPVAVSLGAAGIQGAPGGSGGTAGNSSFGALLTAGGGAGGAYTGAVATTISTVAGSAANGAANPTLGDVNIGGEDGAGVVYPASGSGTLSGKGGNSFLGLGGTGVTALTGPHGRNGKGYGAGGGGASTAGVQNGSGGAGAPAICIITEYCSE